MAMRLTKENVRIAQMTILNDCDIYGREGKEADGMCHYIAGAVDMANVVMKAIEDLGGT